MLARLGIEPRPHGYRPGALPLSYLAMVYQLGLLSMADWISNRIIVTFMVSSTIPAIDTGKRIGRLEYGGEHTQAFVVPMEQQSLSEATRLYAAAAVPLVLAHH